MQVFKFGGASLKTANAVKNMIEIVCKNKDQELVVIVSAMGKTTNNLEAILAKALAKSSFDNELHLLEKYHSDIYEGLNLVSWEDEIKPVFENLKVDLQSASQNDNPDEVYDKIVSYGELLSSTIIYHAFRRSTKDGCHLVDARVCIRTDSRFRDARVDWEETTRAINETCRDMLNTGFILSQGFIGSTNDNRTTTLGREGSDFTAAIFAKALGSKGVTFWKDVPGIMTADPKLDKDARQFLELPYQEAAEMTYYGAKVIHPKTIRPLANDLIPLTVRSFNDSETAGTVIGDFAYWKPMPSFILKPDQCLITIKFSDFHFVNDAILHGVYSNLQELNIRINLMQNSAISISICFDYDENKLQKLLTILNLDFDTYYNTKLALLTIKNYDPATLESQKPRGEILLEQQTRANYRAVFQST